LPQELLGEIAGYLEDKKCEVKLDPKKYKFKTTVKQFSDEDKEEEELEDEQQAQPSEDVP